MTERSSLGIVLAAGEGTRMRSRLPKVLHEVGSRPMVVHAMATARAAGIGRLALVVGPAMEAVEKVVTAAGADLIVHQTERLGTAHAVLRARAAIEQGADDIVVLYGDTPLVRSETVAEVRSKLAQGADLVVLGFRTPQPTGYGRLIEVDGRLVAIREDRKSVV
jgi:bifunctional UDP-N-acetylglucosamine pyrophosphorylase/glucosamine-1-phosphate N-acetyltransferase